MGARWRRWIAVTGVVIVGGVLAPATASSAEVGCPTVQTVWARGSGQGLGAGEGTRWTSRIEELVKTGSVSVSHYELGSSGDTYGGATYNAVGVANVFNGNAIGAAVSGGEGHDYGRSVDVGVSELVAYLVDRTSRCTSTRFVVGGYSQGAQVITEALAKLAADHPSALTRLDFAAMFGDPKLYLPEGEGFWPPACKGQDISPWRRPLPGCLTDNGSLGGRCQAV